MLINNNPKIVYKLVSEDLPLPLFQHLLYYNFKTFGFTYNERSRKYLYELVKSNPGVFNKFYKKLKKVRRRNYYGVDLDINRIETALSALRQIYFLRHDYKSLRRTFACKRQYLFCQLLKKQTTCVTCGTDKNLSVDHIKPLSKGGTNDINNLQIMCVSCNSKKGSKWN